MGAGIYDFMLVTVCCLVSQFWTGLCSSHLSARCLFFYLFFSSNHPFSLLYASYPLKQRVVWWDLHLYTSVYVSFVIFGGGNCLTMVWGSYFYFTNSLNIQPACFKKINKSDEQEEPWKVLLLARWVLYILLESGTPRHSLTHVFLRFPKCNL